MMRVKAMTQPWEVNVTGPDQIRMARRADELGYDMIGVPEHFVIGLDQLEESGPHFFHATAAQGVLAGATETIRINSCLTQLPLQHPVAHAKALATVDWMSGGRVTVTFGVGWNKIEFDVLGVPYHERGRMSDEYLAAMIELWTKEKPEFEGKYVSFKDIAFEPKPVQKPHLPIWMGGDSDPALRRAARFATGWMPAVTKPEDIPAKLDYIKSQPTFRGGRFDVCYILGTTRMGEGHSVSENPEDGAGMPAQEIIDRVSWFKELGVTMTGIPIPPVNGVEAFLDYAQWVMEEIKPKIG
jgi:probable F420-dependent oxidoreductase